jgi:hypothetical protein
MTANHGPAGPADDCGKVSKNIRAFTQAISPNFGRRTVLRSIEDSGRVYVIETYHVERFRPRGEFKGVISAWRAPADDDLTDSDAWTSVGEPGWFISPEAAEVEARAIDDADDVAEVLGDA